MRPTSYHDVHDEFYFYHPAARAQQDRKPIRQVGYDMGLNGIQLTPEFLEDRAELYNGRLNSALHTIDQRAHVVRRRSGDWLRNISLGTLAVGGMAILVLALTVDYKILHDFWTTIYQNKFLQVPESLKDNVMFKSLQVLFAVIAIHFLISAPGILGKAIRGTFMVSIGVMVLAMLVGLGFLAAKSTIPAGSTINGKPVDSRDAGVTVSNDQILQGLGLRPSSGGKAAGTTRSTTAASSRSSVGQEQGVAKVGDVLGKSRAKTFWGKLQSVDLDSAGTLVFFGTFTLIFLFVSSVGALCMHYSLQAVNALFGGVESERPEHKSPDGVLGVAYWAMGKGVWKPKTKKDLDEEHQRILHAQRLIGDPDYRANLMRVFFKEFAAGYTDGLHTRATSARRIIGPPLETLRDQMRDSIAHARDEWTAEHIAERLPPEELRTSLGYDPEMNLGRRKRGTRDGGRLEIIETQPTALPRA